MIFSAAVAAQNELVDTMVNDSTPSTLNCPTGGYSKKIK